MFTGRRQPDACPECIGIGRVLCTACDGVGLVGARQSCAACTEPAKAIFERAGSGTVACPVCDGTGH